MGFWDTSEAPKLAPFDRQIELNIQIVRSFLDSPGPADRVEILQIHEDLFVDPPRSALLRAKQLILKGLPLNLATLAAVGDIAFRTWVLGLAAVVPAPKASIRQLHTDLRVAYKDRMGCLPGRSSWARQSLIHEFEQPL
jgi:hypothetical protein